jgi:hypothetical protein
MIVSKIFDLLLFFVILILVIYSFYGWNSLFIGFFHIGALILWTILYRLIKYNWLSFYKSSKYLTLWIFIVSIIIVVTYFLWYIVEWVLTTIAILIMLAGLDNRIMAIVALICLWYVLRYTSIWFVSVAEAWSISCFYSLFLFFLLSRKKSYE